MKSILLLTLAAAWISGCVTALPPTLSLWDAAERGKVEVVRQHLAAGTDVNARGGITGLTALHQAAFHGREKIAALLIEAGADVNAAGRRGETPLHSTVYWEHRAIAELLLTNGGALGAKLENGQTPLEWAEQLGASSMADLFRNYGLNGENSRGGQSD